MANLQILTKFDAFLRRGDAIVMHSFVSDTLFSKHFFMQEIIWVVNAINFSNSILELEFHLIIK